MALGRRLGPLILAAIGLAAPGPQALAAEDRPNVVFLYTDDQARWAVGVSGNREVCTSNLDRIARAGALFRNAFTANPVCSPSRGSLMTSRYPTQLGIADWIDPNIEPDLGLDPAAITWPEMLRGYGYATALLGKWHLGTADRFLPSRQSFDHFYGFRGGGNRPMDPMLEGGGGVRELKGSLPDLLVDEALRFIDAHRRRPFLVSIHFRAPHAPYAPVPERDSAPYRDLDPTIPDFSGLPRARVKELTRPYYASVVSVDHLDAAGLAGQTVVVFTSDHGYMIGQHGLWHKGNASWLVEGQSGHRPNLFDDAIRVPLLVLRPGAVRPGTVVERVVSNLDLFPSLLEMVGLGTPENLSLAGRSVVPLLRGEAVAWDDTLFHQYDMHHYRVARMRMIRTPEWKLVRHFEPGRADELYDLVADPGEMRNLAGAAEDRARQAELTRRLARWMASIGDPLASGRQTGGN